MTRIGLPGVCHIIPFAFKANDTDALATRALVLGFCKFPGDSRAVCDLLGEYPGSPNKAWNMLTLDHGARKYWSRGRFAFKCLGVTQGESLATIQLQLHWMAHPSNHPNTHCEVDLEDREALYQDIAHLTKTPIALHKLPNKGDGIFKLRRVETGTAVISGDLFEIRMPHDDALKMKSMIDFQWTMISCLALSGAAGWPELLYESTHPDDDASQAEDAHEDPGDSCSPSRSGTVQNLAIRPHSGSPQHQEPIHEDDASSDKQTVLGSPWFDVSTVPRSSLSSESGGEMSSWASDFDL